MKLNKLFLLAGLLIGAFCLTACGDDDEPGYDNPLNEYVIGYYGGWTRLVSGIYPTGKIYEDNNIQIVEGEDGKLQITYSNSIWGVATINGIKVKAGEKDKTYILEEGKGSFVMNNPRDPENPQTFDCQLQSGFLDNNIAELTVVITAQMPGTPHSDMTFTFHTGEVPTE